MHVVLSAGLGRFRGPLPHSVVLVNTGSKYTIATMIDQGQFYKQLTLTLTPLALRERVEKENGSRDGDISTWVCDCLA